MKVRSLKAIAALVMALALLMSFTAPAEDVITVEAESQPTGESLVFADESAEELPGDAAADLTLTVEEAPPSETAGEAPDVTPEPTPEAPAEEEAVANAVPARIEIGVGEKYTLNAASLAAGRKITYKSSKTKVATVSKKGVVTAKKKGAAQVSCYADRVLLASCSVTVVAAPKKVSLGVTKLTLGVNETWQLTPTITKGAHATLTWSSSKKSVASVTTNGLVTARKKGKATITVKTHNGKKAKVTVTVVAAPGKVTLNKTSAKLKPGGTVQLKATLPKKTASRITWTTGDSSVAKVSSSGKVTATGAGSATITASTFNGKTATCAVTVSDASTPTPTPVPTPTPKPAADDGVVKYRALLIGQERFSRDYCPRNRGDVDMMAEMLGSVRGLYGGKYAITKQYDLSTAGVLKAIRTAFASADADDVSLFFIATHGDASSTGDASGALSTCPDGSLWLKDLAAALNEVPGKVIVILESCGSGAAIYANGKSAAEAAEAFDRAAVKAFAEADPGIEMEVPPNGLKSNGLRSNTGEFRLENKFYVLTASDYLELSWGLEDNNIASFNFFTMWLTDAIGTSGAMPADVNGNGQTTLNELYNHIARESSSFAITRHGVNYYQHVQVYPSNSGYVLFTR